MTISAVVITKNEESKIIDCIDTLDFCDEIIVVDDNSKDNTVQLIKNYKGKKIQIFQRSLDNNFSDQRNYALEKAKGKWVLFIDADEIVSSKLSEEILAVVNDDNISAYSIKRKDTFLGVTLEYGETGSMSLVRLVRKNSGKWHGAVHEIWKTKGVTQELKNEISHNPHKNISQFIQKLNFYSTLRAQELYLQKNKSNLLLICIYPLAKFTKNYIVLRGYKDGTVGFIHAVFMSLHSFLVRGKLYLLWKGIQNTY